MAILNDELDSVLLARDNIKKAIINKGQTVDNDLRTYAEAINDLNAIPDGIFIQEDIPTKSTSEAVWLKYVSDDIKASNKIPLNAGSGDISSGSTSKWQTYSRSSSNATTHTWQSILNRLTDEQIEIFNSYSHHFVRSYGWSKGVYFYMELHIIASNNVYRSGSSVNTSGEYYDIFFPFTAGSSTKPTVSVQSGNGGGNSLLFTVEDIYYSDGTTIGYSSNISNTEDGLCYNINTNEKYIVYGNKSVSWNKILDTSKANATTSDILLGKTAFVNNTKITGTMANNGALTIVPSTSQQSIPEGYTSGGTVSAVTASIDSNIIQANIRSGVTILGVEGNLEPDKPDQTKTVTPTTLEQIVAPDVGYELASVTINPVTADIDENIIAENIKKDVTILGITGTLETGSGDIDYNIYIQETEPENKQGIWIKAPTQEYTIQEIDNFNIETNYGFNKLLIVRGTDISTQIIDGITYYFYSCVLTDSEGNNKLEYHKYRGTGNSWVEIEDDFAVLTPEEAIESNSILDSILGQSDQGDTDNLTPEEDIIANQIANDILGNN